MTSLDRNEDFQRMHAIETYKTLMQLGLEGIKLTFLANGGAMVAILAFLGNSASKGIRYPDLSSSMRSFIIGIATACLAIFLGYLMQLKLYNESIRESGRGHGYLLAMAIVVYLCSIAAFAIGSWLSVKTFVNFQG